MQQHQDGSITNTDTNTGIIVDTMTSAFKGTVLTISSETGVCSVSKPLSALPSVPGKDSATVDTAPTLGTHTDVDNTIDNYVSDNSSFMSALSADSPQTLVVPSSAADASDRPYRCVNWCGKKHYSDLMKEGLDFLGQKSDNVIMLFESPSTSSTETSFFNNSVFPVHDYPSSPSVYKTTLAPLRYTIMNGATYPSFLHGDAPEGLLDHWVRRVPGFVMSSFVSELDEAATVYAYLPLEHIKNHLNDPHVHYHLAGKPAIHLMTPDAPELLSNTTDNRPCIAKVTHSMGSKGIFLIRNDEDEEEFREFLSVSGNPSFVVTELVDIHRNLSCHFFIHPGGEITWIGSSENHKDANGEWSIDSIIELYAQDEMKKMQLPYARQVADYCLSVGFWGFCGIDVLFDGTGKGFVVDVNPRTTGTSPSLMLARRLEEQYGYQAGIMRRSASFAFRGSAKELMEQVEAVNEEGSVRIVLLSFAELASDQTLLNISIHGNTLAECRELIERFAQPIISKP